MAVNYQNPAVAIQGAVHILPEEEIGPKTNPRTVRVLHPDYYQTSPDQARIERAPRDGYIDTWIPTKNLNNIKIKSGEYRPTASWNGPVIGMELQGLEGQYVKNQYAGYVNPTTAEPKDEFGTITVPEERKLLDVSQQNKEGNS